MLLHMEHALRMPRMHCFIASQARAVCCCPGCAHSSAELTEWVDELRWGPELALRERGSVVALSAASVSQRDARAAAAAHPCHAHPMRSGCLGLLINLAEQGEEWQAQLRGLELPRSGSSLPMRLVPLLCQLATGARLGAEVSGQAGAGVCMPAAAPTLAQPAFSPCSAPVCAAVLPTDPPTPVAPSRTAAVVAPGRSRGGEDGSRQQASSGGGGEITLDALEEGGADGQDEHRGAERRRH